MKGCFLIALWQPVVKVSRCCRNNVTVACLEEQGCTEMETTIVKKIIILVAGSLTLVRSSALVFAGSKSRERLGFR